MKIYTAKYALSVGVQEYEAVESPNTPGMMVVKTPLNWGDLMFASEGRDWHRTRIEAIARAERLRFGKLRSLRKQIANLEKLQFK